MLGADSIYLDIENLADCSGEPTLRSVGSSLHEDDEGVLSDGLSIRRRHEDGISHMLVIRSHRLATASKLTSSINFLA